MNKVLFTNSSKKDFIITLNKRIESYFKDNNLDKQANWLMVFKSITFLLLFAGIYLLIFFVDFTPVQLLPLVVLFGIAQVLLAFNIAHDASHNAYSKNPFINKTLQYTWNLIGISSYMWDMKHNLAHHTYTNVAGSDHDIQQAGFLRLHPHDPLMKHHKYQHLYVPILYSLFSIYLIFIKDFQMYSVKQWGNKAIHAHPTKEWVILYFTKLFYITYAIILPLMFLNISWWQFLIGFVVMHMVIGLIVAFVLTPVHVTTGTEFPLANEEGKIDNSWLAHQIEATIDWNADNRVVNWFVGGLNTHVAHHMFSNICHIHYLEITKIIKQTAEEYGVRYQNRTFFGAMYTHLKFLKLLGREKSPSLV